MNIYDISKRAGVSIATVSRVINGNEKVSEKTRQKVLAVMEETGYVPNAFARGLGLDTMKTIGILCVDSSDNFLASAVYYLEQELRNYNYDVLLCCTGYTLETKQKYLELLLSKRVDAVILAGSNYVEQGREENRYIIEAAKRVPIVILNAYLEGDNIYCVLCDDRKAMARVAKAYLQAGKREMLYIGRRLSYSGICKKEGFQQAYREAGLEMKRHQVLIENRSIEEIRELLIERKKQGLEQEVILTSDEELAIGALKYAKALGIRVPEDLEIVGYNNSKLGICCEPELTCVDNQLESSCMQAVTLLMQVLAGEKVPSRTTINAEIVTRKTTTVVFE